VTTTAALQGTLEEFPLDAVMAMLSRSRQVGALEVSAPGLPDGRATVWFDDGNVHVASLEDAIDTLFQLLVTGGGFEFHQTDRAALPDGLGEVVPADDVLAEVDDRLREWRVIAELIPSTAVVLRLSAALPPGAEQLVVTPEEWEVLARLDGVRSVAEVTRSVGMGAFEVCRVLHRLRAAGAVEPVEPVESPVEGVVEEA
jgi:hypothetical protein